MFRQYYLQRYSLTQIASDEENVHCTKGGRDFYSHLIFLISIITESCTQHLLKALSVLHTKAIREGWRKNCYDIVLKIISWFGWVWFFCFVLFCFF